MALRVLLADESSTIKRVMQLALQDFGVDVKSVPIGIDVLPMSKSFKPDIVFADVLLQKKSGYDVSKELKNDPATSHIPVVLMWSSFMEFDQARGQESKADQRIEKPFDAETLRKIVQDLVKKTQTNIVSQYLKFPKMPEFTEEPMSAGAPQPPTLEAQPIELKQVDEFETPQIEEIQIDENPFAEKIEDANPVGLTSQSGADEQFEEISDNWSHQDLGKINHGSPAFNEIQIDNTPAPHLTKTAPKGVASSFEQFMIPNAASGIGSQSNVQTESSGEFEEVTFIAPPKADVKETDFVKKPTALESAQIENVIREEAKAMIESICWKIIPDIAERIIREEINKLLKDAEKNI